jgi:MFS family permease
VLGAAGLLQLALALNALSFVVVALAGLALRARRSPVGAQAADQPIRARDGLAFLVHDRALAVTLGGAVAALGVFTMSATAEPFFVIDVLGAGSFGYGLLITAWTLGMAAGAAGIAHRIPSASLAAAALVAIVAQGIGIVGAAVSPVLWTALIGFAFGGVAHGVKNVLLRTLIHERAPEAMRGRAFAAYNGARNGAELGALALGGLVVGAFGARTGLLASGLGPTAIGLTCLLFLTTSRRRAAAAPTHDGRTIHARVHI